MKDLQRDPRPDRIPFENDAFVVADKPAGVLTVPDRGVADTARAVLGLELQRMLGVQIFPVHRLDFVVSGLVLFAKTAEAHRVANGWFEQHRVQKTYRAWTQPQTFAHIPADVPNPRRAIALHEGDRFDWHGRIQRGKRRAFESPRGQPSHTIAVYLGPHPHNRFLQWDLQAVTGRPHQLRFDLSRHGFPIVGDALYGSNVEFGVDRIALLAYRLDFSAITEGDRFGLPERIEIAPEF